MSNGEETVGTFDTVSTTATALSEPVIYVGPGSIKLGLTYMQVYSEYTDVVKNALDANPALGLLLVPVSQFDSVRSQVVGPDPAAGYISHAVELLNQNGVL